MRVLNDPRNRTVMVVIGLAACSALALMGCSGSSDSADSTDSIDSTELSDMEVPGELESPGDAAAPVVVLRPDGWTPPMPPEADILADRLLRREYDSLLLEAAERRQLADEISAVLLSIRDAYPTVADITVRVPYLFGELLLGLEPQLFETVASLLEDAAGPVALHTGYAEFDTLNESLGLSVVVALHQRSGIR